MARNCNLVGGAVGVDLVSDVISTALHTAIGTLVAR
jgi:hypothetical protein